MRPVQADFAARSLPSRAAWGCLAVLAIVSVLMAWDTHRIRADFKAREADVHGQQVKARALVAAQRAADDERAASSPQASQLRAFRRVREVPWPEVLAALEVTPRGALTIASIQIDALARVVELEATALDQESVVEYVKLLNEGMSPGDLGWRWTLREVRRQPHANAFAISMRAIWGRD